MCIISTAQQARPKVIGHIDPCRAQLTTLSSVDRTYSTYDQLKSTPRPNSGASRYDLPAPLRGVSRLSWLDPCCAIRVTGFVTDGVESEELMDADGVLGRSAIAVFEIGRARARLAYFLVSSEWLQHTDGECRSESRGGCPKRAYIVSHYQSMHESRMYLIADRWRVRWPWCRPVSKTNEGDVPKDQRCVYKGE